MGIHKITKILNLKNLRSTQVSPNLRIPQGVQAFTTVFLGLLTSFVWRRGSKSSRLLSVFAPALALTIAALGISLFSQTAYAASYINVSSGSGGTISFDSIKPSSAGVSASASDTLTITTNCSAGYKVYVSGQEDGDTNLTNSSASSNNTISASSTAVGSTATTLNSNTWGITGDSANASANKYVGLPAYANATDAALITVPSANTSGNNTNTIYYGVKVDTTLTPGTYSGDVLYTTLVTEACNNYTVHFNANGGTGTMNDQTIPVGTATNLTANAFYRSGYAFLGWSTDEEGTTPAYKDQEEVTDISDFNTTITLYAIWGKIASAMQDAQCSKLPVDATTYLTDARDGQAYSVYRWPMAGIARTDYPTDMAGVCIMTKDLALGLETGGDITEATNFTVTSTGSTFYSDTPSVNAEITSNNSYAITYGDANNGGSEWSTLNYSNDKMAVNKQYAFGSDEYAVGYYSWGAAIVVCPKGWRLMTNVEQSSLQSFFGGNNTTSATKAQADPYRFLAYTGYYGPNGIVNYHGGLRTTYGFYWSATQVDNNHAYGTIIGPNNYISGVTDANKWGGHLVRCIAESDYAIVYSSTGADSGEPSTTSEVAYESGSVTMPTVGSMKKDGYEFKGWALTSGATNATYIAEQTVTISDLITAASSAGQTTTPGSTITLYPVWTQSYDADMQSWEGCSSLATNGIIRLRDTRDGNVYAVKKLADGKCWMVENLKLTNYKLTSADSDVTSDFDLTTGVKYSGASGWCTTDDATCDNVKALYYDSTQTSNSSNSSYYGALYNWYTATAGTGTYAMSSGDAISSICPKGWHLPKGGSPVDANEFSILDKAWGGTGANRSSANTYSTFTGAYGTGDNGGFGLAGYISGSTSGIDSNGAYWSPTTKDSNNAHNLGLNKNNALVYPQSNSAKYRGYSVRCVAEPPVEDCSETVHPTTTTGCKMKDDNIWIYGNNGSTTTWSASYTCPTGYSSPSKDTFDSLVSAQGSGNQLYSAIGFSGLRGFWSTTQSNSSYAYYLSVGNISAGAGGGYGKTGLSYVLCYK